MSLNKKRAIFVISFLLFGFFVYMPLGVKLAYMASLNTEVSGTVIGINWHSENHDVALFKINNKDGKVITFSDGMFILDNDQIKVGDHITKTKGSQMCSVNKKSILCIQDYVSFYTALGNLFNKILGKTHA